MSEKQNTPQGPAETLESARQPIFFLPLSITILAGLMLAIQLASDVVLNDSGREKLLTWFAFVPVRLTQPDALDGGWWPLLWTPITHAFLHGGWEHVILNVAWLVIFGAPVTQRYGGLKMLVLFGIGAVLGAVAFAATTLPNVAVLVGASGGVAALTGAAMRFVFQPPLIVDMPESGERMVLGRKLATLREFVSNGRARFFSIMWLVLNAAVPLLPVVFGGSGAVAWQAHLVGFLAGLLLVPLFERQEI